jgi:hypothetical protein
MQNYIRRYLIIKHVTKMVQNIRQRLDCISEYSVANYFISNRLRTTGTPKIWEPLATIHLLW